VTTSQQGKMNVGMLEVTIEQSTADLTAGERFNFYVLIRNPLQVPCWIDSVRLGIPSGFELPQFQDANKQAAKSKFREKVEDFEWYSQKVDGYQNELKKIIEQIKALGASAVPDLNERKVQLENTIRQLHIRDRNMKWGSMYQAEV